MWWAGTAATSRAWTAARPGSIPLRRGGISAGLIFNPIRFQCLIFSTPLLSAEHGKVQQQIIAHTYSTCIHTVHYCILTYIQCIVKMHTYIHTYIHTYKVHIIFYLRCSTVFHVCMYVCMYVCVLRFSNTDILIDRMYVCLDWVRSARSTGTVCKR